MEEIWKDIPTFEGLYKASTLGRIASYDRKVNYKNFGKIATKKGKILTPKESKGYLEVVLCDNEGKHYCRKVHRLVAEAFIPNSNNYQTINHIDEDKHNNRASNLEWCSVKENVEKYHSNRMCLYQYNLMGKLIATWDSITKAAKVAGGDKTGVQHCAKGKLKTYLGYIWSYQELTKEELKSRTTNERKCEVVQFDLQGNYIQTFESARQAAKAVNCCSPAIVLACEGSRKTIKGFIWKYKKHLQV